MASKQAVATPDFQYIVDGGPEKMLGFDIVDDLGEVTHYSPGEVFTPGPKWQELPPQPDDESNFVRFGVPYITNPEAKPSERVVSSRTMILRLKKVAVKKE